MDSDYRELRRNKIECESCCIVLIKIIRNLYKHYKWRLIFAWKIITILLILYQVYKVIDFLISYTELKELSNEPYYFQPMCSCAPYVALNGTINDMLTGQQIGTNYNNINSRPYFFLLYPALVGLKLFEFVISIIVNYVIYQRVKREQKTDGQVWRILFTLIIALITVILIPISISKLKMNTNNNGKIYGNIWFYECAPDFVPVATLNSLECPCLYINTVCTSNYNMPLYIECVQIDIDSMQGYDSYLDLLTLYKKLLSLSIVYVLISVNDILIGSIVGMTELLVKCCI